MRLSSKISAVITALAIELAIVGLIALIYMYQYSRAEEQLTIKTQAIVQTIGEQATSFFSQRGESASSDEFFLFLDERLGRKKLFNTFDVAPKFFSVLLRKDAERGGLFDRFSQDFYPTRGSNIQKSSGLLSVSVPFFASGDTLPYGIVKIDSGIAELRQAVLKENFLLYAAILVVLNSQSFIMYLLLAARKKREIVFEKGYLKEHSIGALKIFHRVLGDIIEDHTAREIAESTHVEEDSSEHQVISLAELLESKKK